MKPSIRRLARVRSTNHIRAFYRLPALLSSSPATPRRRSTRSSIFNSISRFRKRRQRHPLLSQRPMLRLWTSQPKLLWLVPRQTSMRRLQVRRRSQSTLSSSLLHLRSQSSNSLLVHQTQLLSSEASSKLLLHNKLQRLKSGRPSRRPQSSKTWTTRVLRLQSLMTLNVAVARTRSLCRRVCV